MSEPLVQAIGWALLHLLWQGILVAAILAATLALLHRRSANARYLASCGALLLLVVLGTATAYRAYEPNVAASFSPPAPLKPAVMLMDSAANEVPAATLDLISIANAHLNQIVAIWLAGVLILSARLIAGWIGARRLASRATQAAGEQWERSLWRIASTLRLWRPIKLLESAAVDVPTVVGWLRPVVLLPVASLSGLSMQQIEMVLAHELAHIRRHDFIINLLQSVIETLLFYHPAVWWISRRIRVEREHCCDDLAVAVFGDPLQYARALTRFEEMRLNSQAVVAANGGSLLSRIRRLVVERAESAHWSSRWAAGAALLAVVAVIVVAPALPLFAKHDEQKKTPSPPAAPEQLKTTPSPDKASTAPQATVEVDAGDESSSDETDTETPQPSPHPIPAIAPHIAANVGDAVSAALADVAPVAGIEGGVVGGILGGVRTEVHVRPRRHIGEGGKLSVDDLITLRSAGVDSKYIESMRAAGLGDLSLDDIVALRLQGVTPKYIKEMSDAGYQNLSARDLSQLSAMGVGPDFIKSLADAGYAKLTVRELVRLKASGVDADFIRDLAKYRSK